MDDQLAIAALGDDRLDALGGLALQRAARSDDGDGALLLTAPSETDVPQGSSLASPRQSPRPEARDFDVFWVLARGIGLRPVRGRARPSLAS